jgi:hypothetical protein
MVTSLQLSELAGSIRQDAINQLSQVATDFSLSYEFDEDRMIITLPKYDDVELPVVAKIEVPTEEEKK